MRGLGAAVSMIGGDDGVQGVTRLVQTDSDNCVIEGTLDGLKPGKKHHIKIHEFGDISKGCYRFDYNYVLNLVSYVVFCSCPL